MSNPKILSVRQVAGHMGITSAEVERLCKTGSIKGWQIGPSRKRVWRVARGAF